MFFLQKLHFIFLFLTFFAVVWLVSPFLQFFFCATAGSKLRSFFDAVFERRDSLGELPLVLHRVVGTKLDRLFLSAEFSSTFPRNVQLNFWHLGKTRECSFFDCSRNNFWKFFWWFFSVSGVVWLSKRTRGNDSGWRRTEAVCLFFLLVFGPSLCWSC